VNRAGRFDAGRLFYLNWLEEYLSVEGLGGHKSGMNFKSKKIKV
jgi:hypothetical protein